MGSYAAIRRVDLEAWLAERDTDRAVPLGWEKISLSPDGQRFIVAYWRGLPLVDMASLAVIHSLPVAEYSANDVAWTPDGSRVVLGTGRGVVAVYEAQSGELVRSIPIPGRDPTSTREERVSVAVADHGRVLLAAWDKGGQVWAFDLASGEELRRLATGLTGIRHLEVSPDARNLVVGGNGGERECWDLATWTRRTDVALPGGVRMRFSPDGKRLAMQVGGGITIAGFPAGPRLDLQVSRSAIRSLSFSPDGRRLAAAVSGGAVLLCDTTTGAQLLTLRGHSDEVFWAEFAGAGRRLLSSGHDRRLVSRDADPWQ